MRVYVANAPGDDYDPTVPSGYDSWIDYWNQSKGKQAGVCRNCGTKTSDLDGSHVECCEQRSDGKWHYNKQKGVYITPLCPECNNPANTARFSVDAADLVKVP